MNQEETIALFERCEKARAEARAAGKDDAAAHEAAKDVWNTWAGEMLANRRMLERVGGWVAGKVGGWAEESNWEGECEPRYNNTFVWMMSAAVNFSRVRFIAALAQNSESQVGEALKSNDTECPTVKLISVDGDMVRLDGFVFPGNAWFGGAQFSGDTRFDSAQFSGIAEFERAQFSGTAGFERAQFSDSAKFEDAQFSGDAMFESAQFGGSAGFPSAQFSGAAMFEGAQFSGTAWFGGAQFSDSARFEKAQFSGGAWFPMAQFSDSARFESAQFSGISRFWSAQFGGDAQFNSAQFSGDAEFEGAQFSGDAKFANAQFSGSASFRRAQFSGTAWFGGAQFVTNAFFDHVKFRGSATFFLAKFEHFASFADARFCKGANFGAIRGERAFLLAEAEFDGVPDFIQAHFEEAPRLDNIRVRACMIDPPPEDTPEPSEEKPEPREDAPEVPSLPATDGNAAPSGRWARLRNSRIARAANGASRRVTAAKSSVARRTRAVLAAAKSSFARRRTWPARAVKGVWRRVSAADHTIPARFRALKRIALQGHDADREHEFFGREIRHARFAGDWPLPWPFWKLEGWAGTARFWWGLGYQVFGGLGTSLIRPFIWWLLTVGIAATLYLGEDPEMIRERQILRDATGVSCSPPTRKAPPTPHGMRPARATSRLRPLTSTSPMSARSPQRPRGHRRPHRSAASRVPQRLHRAGRRRRRRAPHLWLPLRRGAVRRLQPGDGGAELGFHRLRRAETRLRAVHLPVRPRGAQHAEDEMTGARSSALPHHLAEFSIGEIMRICCVRLNSASSQTGYSTCPSASPSRKLGWPLRGAAPIPPQATPEAHR